MGRAVEGLKMSDEINRQTHIITSPFNEKMLIEGVTSQLKRKIFTDLREKYGVKVPGIMQTVDAPDPL